MLSNALWQTQTALHGKDNNIVLPAMLVVAASGLVVYKHFVDVQGGDPIKHFLALVVIQMLPLVFLQLKILSCPDPVTMLSRFGTKTLLMHTCFLALRVCAWPLLEVGLGFCNLLGLIAACAALYWGFNFRCSSIRSHMDVCGLWLLAGLGAVCTELLDFSRTGILLESTIFATSNYIELLAFVPAVWMVQQAVKKKDDSYVTGSDHVVQVQATFFFAFLVLYYVMEDVISAIRVGGDAPLAAFGHIVHFLLLLDFACFLLAKIYNPDQVHGSFLRRIPDQFWV
jgi:hypothetical protein